MPFHLFFYFMPAIDLSIGCAHSRTIQWSYRIVSSSLDQLCTIIFTLPNLLKLNRDKFLEKKVMYEELKIAYIALASDSDR